MHVYFSVYHLVEILFCFFAIYVCIWLRINLVINNGNLTATNRKLQTPSKQYLRLDTTTHAYLDALKAIENSVPKLSYIFNSLRIALGIKSWY